jgi:hypothetical protein
MEIENNGQYFSEWWPTGIKREEYTNYQFYF